jgi:hypothetical protein
MLKDVEFIIRNLYKTSPNNNTGYTVLFFFLTKENVGIQIGQMDSRLTQVK